MQVTESANHVSSPTQFKHPPADFIGACLHLTYHRHERNVVGPQFIRVELNLVLPDKATDGRDFRDARNGFKLIAQVPILQAAQVSEAMLMAVIQHYILVDPARARGVRPDGRVNARGQASCDLLKVFDHTRPRPVQVGSVLKNNKDVGVAEHRLGADRLHVWRCQQRGNNWVGNLILNNVRRLAFPRGMDDHLYV